MRFVLTALCLFMSLPAIASIPSNYLTASAQKLELDRVLTVLKEDMGMPLIEPDDQLVSGGITTGLLTGPFSKYYNARFGRIIDEKAFERATSYGTVCGGRLSGTYGMTPKCIASWIRRGQP